MHPDQVIRLKAFALQYLESKERAFPKKLRKVETRTRLDGTTEETGPAVYTRGGVITVFEKAIVYDTPHDAVKFWINRKGRKTRFGDFIGFMYGEVPVHSDVRLIFEYTVDEAHIEARKRLRRSLRDRGVPRWWFDKHQAKSTLDRYTRPKK